jgi:hypothetical protein
MYKHNNKTVWRCVDWDSKKGEERFERGKNRYDPYIVSMTTGTNGIYMGSEKLDLEEDDSPCIFRGLGKSPLIHKCIEKGIDYMYIDTGYFGNGKKKQYHRVAFNNLQTLNHRSIDSVKKLLTSGIGDKETRAYFKRADDIFNSGQAFENWYKTGDIQHLDTVPLENVERGEKILVVPPSQKVFNHFGGEAIEWTNKLIENIKKVTDRPIEIREKVGRSERQNFSLQDQLRTGEYHCIVTFNSIASVEAVTVGVPAIVLGPNAGSYLSETKLENIDTPFFPDKKQIIEHMFYLSCCQFTAEQMQSIITKRTIELLQGDQTPGALTI